VEREDLAAPKRSLFYISVNLDRPRTITETAFFSKIERMPRFEKTNYLLVG
jgi:hypothetical protein